ncbi:unnamed protein product [Microthlaspi erraticum]|uniref:Arabidopsis retrotransposon Orf1 C-terminal domain-containing protein n=1 Tax=Microthlaspi erraticum TaxID=1685480 RepID=A0A6D2KHK1_9BRAS|nr:unnamed protein product [Microthlaspi erraticum]
MDGSEHESNENGPMEEAEPQEEEDELPMFQEHYNALLSMEFLETKYPHDKTMKALGIFNDVELVLKNMHLRRFFSHRMESYKELTCEFLASLRYHLYDEEDRTDLDQGLGWITFLALGVKRMGIQSVWATIAEGEFCSSRSKAAQIRRPVLRYVHKALANTFFARKATGTINEGELKLLDMGIKPIISHTSDGKRIKGDRSNTGNLMPFLDHLLTYKTTAYNTRYQQGRKLSVGVHTPHGWPFQSSCPTQAHHSCRGTTLTSDPHFTLVGHEDDLREEEPELDRVEDRAEDRAQVDEVLGEPDCYYFEEYEAPRMNPSVVAAHKRIGLLQKFNKWQGKAQRKCKSPWKMVSKIKSLEKKVWFFIKKKKTPMASTFPRSRSLLTTPRRLPAQEPHRASSFEPREEGRQHAEEEEEFQARRSNSTSGLDRVQTEETQLDRADGRVDLEEPVFENPGFEYDPAPYQDYPQSMEPIRPVRASQAPPRPREPHTLQGRRRRESRKLDRAAWIWSMECS